LRPVHLQFWWVETAALIAVGAHRMDMPFLVVARLEWNRPGLDKATTGDAIAVAR
jgi:hypothetical protein